MGNDDLAIRFSNETYATRSEVAKALRTNLIDSFWTNIIKYRGQFTRYLSVHGIDHSQLTIVLTPYIADSINALERKLMKAWMRLSKLPKSSSAYAMFTQGFFASQLEAIAKKYRLGINESYIKSVVSDTLSTVSPDRMILVNYLAAHRYIAQNSHDPIDEAFFASIYAIISGQEDLRQLYREHEIASLEQKALINKTYAAAPIARIEEMMKELLEFIIHSDFSPIIKAIVVFYCIMLVKPFETYSEEMALLTFKNVLVHADFDDVPLLLALENVLLDEDEELSRLMLEIQKTGDVTYLIVGLLPHLDRAITALLDGALEFDKQDLQTERLGPAQPLVNETVDEEIEQIPNSGAPNKGNRPLTVDERMALPSVPIALDEVDASRIEEHLMETNPALKRGEAYFYARHCTIGKFYTISQFKKTLGCAYETARTSMDHLASLGYYRKESYKNKFIYTPVNRK